MIIFIKHLSGRIASFKVEPSDYIEMIKTQCKSEFNIPIDDIGLTFEGKQLEDSRNLSEYNIKANSQLYIYLRLKGGGFAPLMFNSLEKPISQKFAENGPKWREACTGMNLNGTCINKKCVAFSQSIVCQKGFGIFNIAKESLMSRCPICGDIAKDSNNIYFWKCEYTVNGQVKGEAKQKSYTKRVKGEDSFETFENKDGDQREWVFLEIIVKKI